MIVGLTVGMVHDLSVEGEGVFVDGLIVLEELKIGTVVQLSNRRMNET